MMISGSTIEPRKLKLMKIALFRRIDAVGLPGDERSDVVAAAIEGARGLRIGAGDRLEFLDWLELHGLEGLREVIPRPPPHDTVRLVTIDIDGNFYAGLFSRSGLLRALRAS